MNTNRLSKVYCAVSGVKFYVVDSIGIQYVVESNKCHPAFLDTDNMRTILKFEANKNLKPEALHTLDWQDISLGTESDFDVPKENQILAKSFIVGVIFAQLAANRLSFSRLPGKKLHELNLALCKHRRRSQLLWWARRLCTWEKGRRADKINLDTVYESDTGKPYQTKNWSDSIGLYLTSIIEDDSSKLPRIRGIAQSSITIYDKEIAKRARQRRAQKPLNGQHVDWGIDKAIACIGTLKAAGVIPKQKAMNITMALTHWADYPEETREKLGHRLIELSSATQLKSDYATVLERIGYGFVTGEISSIANTSKYTLGDTFLGERLEKPKAKRPSLMLKLRARG
jgi:hypothetical protein